MTKYAKVTPLFTALALALSAAPTLVAAQNSMAVDNGKTALQLGTIPASPDFRLKGQTGPTHNPTPDPFCENVFVVYEEDANGNPVPGTYDYGCDD